MMTIAKAAQVLAMASVITIASGPVTSHAQPPSFHHYYYVYPGSMTLCGELVAEVFKNIHGNWKFTQKELTATAAAFSVGDVGGRLRCLAKEPKESWVVMITTGNDSRKTRDLFEEIRLGVCGECSALAATGKTSGPAGRTRVPSPATGNCSISGRATGSRVKVADVFKVLLLGPDNQKLERNSAPARQFTFSGLPDGRYRLSLDTKADVIVKINPPHREIVCRGAAITNMNFEFH